MKTSHQYRDKLLDDLTKEISMLKVEGIESIIITGDINQDIKHDQIQKFMRENGLYEIHQELIDHDHNDRDKTYKNGRN